MKHIVVGRMGQGMSMSSVYKASQEFIRRNDMKVSMTLKEGKTWEDAINVLTEIAEKEARIERDPHTNKHFILKDGRIWHKGQGTGKYWDFHCSQAEAHWKAWQMVTI